MTTRPKNFLFFNLIPKTVFMVSIGVFTTFTLLFSTLYCLFVSTLYAQMSCFFALGAGVFFVSYFLYKYKFFDILKIPSYKSYVISKKTLMRWMLVTLNVYFFLCWYLMLLLGLFNGFGITHPSNSNLYILCENQQLLKFRAIILLVIHTFLIGVYLYGKKYIANMFIIAHHKLNIRRQNIQISKDDAAKVVYQ